MGSGVQICQMIGEPHDQIMYTECVKCIFKTCPIREIFGILSYIAPQVMEEIYEEVRGLTSKGEN